jgi:homoserine O-acetyltransferase
MSLETFVSNETQSLTLPDSLALEGGERLEDVKVAVRTWGRLNPAGDNAVLVCHALTGTADVDDWWEKLLGPGRALDPEKDFIVATNVLGGCYGSTGPRPGLSFPPITIRDQVSAQAKALESLGVRGLELVIGGSMGGMQALEWGVIEPLPVRAVSAIGTPASHSPWAVGLADTQRAAIRSDPEWKGGTYDPHHPPREGLAIARMIAMCTYRSAGSFRLRFDREKHPAGHFQVENYLRYQGRKLGDRFDPNSYLTLTEAMDTHDLARDRGTLEEVLGSYRPPVLVVGIPSDVLYTPEEIQELAAGIPHAELAWIDSPHGHDAFLMEQETLSDLVRAFRHRLSKERSGPGNFVSDGGPTRHQTERRDERCA